MFLQLIKGNPLRLQLLLRLLHQHTLPLRHRLQILLRHIAIVKLRVIREHARHQGGLDGLRATVGAEDLIESIDAVLIKYIVGVVISPQHGLLLLFIVDVFGAPGYAEEGLGLVAGWV